MLQGVSIFLNYVFGFEVFGVELLLFSLKACAPTFKETNKCTSNVEKWWRARAPGVLPRGPRCAGANIFRSTRVPFGSRPKFEAGRSRRPSRRPRRTMR
jgi:hypothetical protein